MERKVAAEIVSMLVTATQQVVDTVDVYRQHSGNQAAQDYADAAGRVAFKIYELLHPIISEHPDLDPGRS